MGNTFLYPHDKGAEALILLVRELLGLLADDLHTHGLDVQCAFSAKAVGLCGLDGSMLKADKLPAAEDLGFVGEIREVNTRIVEDAIASGYTPVISTVAAGYHGEVYNINADVAAARIAAELGARKLILMTDIVGLLRDKDDENTLIPVVNVSDVPKLKRDGIISGGMIPKIDCCVEAVRRGVERAHIIDGRTPHSILVELFTDEGIGTMFY